MRKLIYLYNNIHLNKVSLTFVVISLMFIFFCVNACVSIDLNNLEDLRNYQSLTKIFFFDIYNLLEIIISMFVIVLSFMELYNNAHLFDIIYIAKENKTKVLTAKLISYLMIVITYITIVFGIISLICLVGFQDIYLLKEVYLIYKYMLLIGILTLLITIILLTLFKNYFASFLIIMFVLVKRIILEENNSKLNNYVPSLNTDTFTLSTSNTLIIIYLISLIFICFIIFKIKDIKT